MKTGTVTFSVLGLVVAGCSGSAAPMGKPTAEPARVVSAPGARARSTPVVAPGEEQLPVSEAVTKLHRGAFEPTDVEATLGRPICFITLHDADLKEGAFYPLVLFRDGSIGTWRQTPTGHEDELAAKLSPEEAAARLEAGRSHRRRARARPGDVRRLDSGDGREHARG